MDMIHLSDGEYRLMEIAWEWKEIQATELARICLEKYDWKKSTVYTMLKRLGEKNVLRFENKVVTPLVNKEQIDKQESQELLNKAFGGSLSAFVAAFLQDRKLTEKEALELQKMIREAMHE